MKIQNSSTLKKRTLFGVDSVIKVINNDCIQIRRRHTGASAAVMLRQAK